MGHFYGYVVLPETFIPSGDAAIIEFVRSILAPYEPEQDECFPFASYSVVDKNWYSRVGDLVTDFPQAISDSGLVIVPAHVLLSNDEPYAFIAPDGEWHQSGSTYAFIDEGWPQRFRELVEPYRGRLAAAIYFKC